MYGDMCAMEVSIYKHTKRTYNFKGIEENNVDEIKHSSYCCIPSRNLLGIVFYYQQKTATSRATLIDFGCKSLSSDRCPA